MIFKQIKFRIIYKNPANGVWENTQAHCIELDNVGANKAYGIDNSEGLINWDNAYLLQFAGGLDAGGKEIYHADILKSANGTLYEVISVFSGFAVLDEAGEPVFLSDAFCRTVEVVGNVIQNPELVELPVEEMQKAFKPKEKKVYKLGK